MYVFPSVSLIHTYNRQKALKSKKNLNFFIHNFEELKYEAVSSVTYYYMRMYYVFVKKYPDKRITSGQCGIQENWELTCYSVAVKRLFVHVPTFSFSWPGWLDLTWLLYRCMPPSCQRKKGSGIWNLVWHKNTHRTDTHTTQVFWSRRQGKSNNSQFDWRWSSTFPLITGLFFPFLLWSGLVTPSDSDELSFHSLFVLSPYLLYRLAWLASFYIFSH